MLDFIQTILFKLARKLFLIGLLALLPLQFSQAALCSYCEFELDTTTTQQQAGAQTSDQQVTAVVLDQSKLGQQGNGFHNDCGVCHLCLAKLIRAQSELMVVPMVPAIISNEVAHPYPLITSGIERPNWYFAV